MIYSNIHINLLITRFLALLWVQNMSEDSFLDFDIQDFWLRCHCWVYEVAYVYLKEVSDFAQGLKTRLRGVGTPLRHRSRIASKLLCEPLVGLLLLCKYDFQSVKIIFHQFLLLANISDRHVNRS